MWKKINKKSKTQPLDSITVKQSNGLGNPWMLGIGKEIAEKLDYRLSVFVDDAGKKVGIAKDLNGYKLNRTSRWITRNFGFKKGVYPMKWSEEEQMFVGDIKLKDDNDGD